MKNAWLWKAVIKAKYGVLNNWYTKQSRLPYGTSPWKHISKLWDEFQLNSKLEVRNGAQ